MLNGRFNRVSRPKIGIPVHSQRAALRHIYLRRRQGPSLGIVKFREVPLTALMSSRHHISVSRSDPPSPDARITRVWAHSYSGGLDL